MPAAPCTPSEGEKGLDTGDSCRLIGRLAPIRLLLFRQQPTRESQEQRPLPEEPIILVEWNA